MQALKRKTEKLFVSKEKKKFNRIGYKTPLRNLIMLRLEIAQIRTYQSKFVLTKCNIIRKTHAKTGCGNSTLFYF